MKLSIVAPYSKDKDATDIQALNMRDILKRDWAACHIEGDRRAPWRKMVWRG